MISNSTWLLQEVHHDVKIYVITPKRYIITSKNFMASQKCPSWRQEVWQYVMMSNPLWLREQARHDVKSMEHTS